MHILATTCPYIKNRIFEENRDFHEFWQNLINRNSTDWLAGNGRIDDTYSEIYSLDILKAFSYSDHHYMMSRLNFKVV